MRILCFTDNHFSEKSSIITKFGTHYTTRLENQLKSINWVEEQAVANNCQLIVCLGDFFDHAQLTDQELTALQNIKWSGIQHYFLVGNHESEEQDLQYSSTMALIGPQRAVISEPTVQKLDSDNLELAFLPYVLESNKKPLTEYFPAVSDALRILFSHNDILGLQLGPVIARTGYSKEELEEISHLCINGHLHNGQQVSSRVVNLGNLTGKDFGEDAFRYSHRIMIIDTNSMNVDFIENPHAFNFYKIDINAIEELARLLELKNNAVVSVRCKDFLVKQVRELLEAQNNIVDFRVIVTKSTLEDSQDNIDISDLCVDQCTKFAECCRAKLDNTEILEAELAQILK